MPKAAICDPELTWACRRGPTAATGMDAFTHCLEAYLANGFHPLADALAIDGIPRVARSLPVALQDGKDLGARADMMVAAMEGAMAFQKGLGRATRWRTRSRPIAACTTGWPTRSCCPSVMEFNRGVPARGWRGWRWRWANRSAREEVLAGQAIERVRKLNARRRAFRRGCATRA